MRFVLLLMLAISGCASGLQSAVRSESALASVTFPEDLRLVVFCDGEVVQRLEADAHQPTAVAVPYSGCSEVVVKQETSP